jgi:hypothetical protein
MPIPSDGPWVITIGSAAGVPLNFTNITDNSVSGQFGSTEFSGFFDEASQTLTFSDASIMSKGSTSGLVFTPFTVYQATLLTVGSGPYYLLAGVSYTNSGPGGPVAASWYAQYPEPTTPPPTTPTPTPTHTFPTITRTHTIRTPFPT